MPNFYQRLWQALSARWREESARRNPLAASVTIVRELGAFVRDSTPERRRSRYGDMEYDWEHRVNTTSGGVGWRERLLGIFHSPYQPTEAALFREMMAALPIDFTEYTFVDLGSGKGRTLLMASEYPFRKIVGVEILPELHRTAQENIRAFHSPTQRCRQIECVCADARDFALPPEPTVLYLFNPLPEAALRQVMGRLAQTARPFWIVYHNALLEHVLSESGWLQRIGRTEQYVLYRRLSSI